MQPRRFVIPRACRYVSATVPWIGCDIAQHLDRHGASVELVEVASRGRSIAEVILAHAKESGADLLVCGARNPAHLREMVFGNATRKLLSKMPVPVLVSR